jgi:hypothetical protein
MVGAQVLFQEKRRDEVPVMITIMITITIVITITMMIGRRVWADTPPNSSAVHD